jgi:hypothetical protein
MIENKSQRNIGGMHRSLTCSGKVLVSVKHGACGSPTSPELAPSPGTPCDDGPTRYAHAMTN